MSEMTPEEEMKIIASEMYSMQMIDRWTRQDHEVYDSLKARYNKLANENGGLHPIFNAILQNVTGEA
jgi:hypothetical protein